MAKPVEARRARRRISENELSARTAGSRVSTDHDLAMIKSENEFLRITARPRARTNTLMSNTERWRNTRRV